MKKDYYFNRVKGERWLNSVSFYKAYDTIALQYQYSFTYIYIYIYTLDVLLSAFSTNFIRCSSEIYLNIYTRVKCSQQDGNGVPLKRTTLHDLYELQGQSPWYDNLCRPVTDLLPFIASGVRGVTSNPTVIFIHKLKSYPINLSMRSICILFFIGVHLLFQPNCSFFFLFFLHFCRFSRKLYLHQVHMMSNSGIQLFSFSISIFITIYARLKPLLV